jgi:hypothetical protein
MARLERALPGAILLGARFGRPGYEAKFALLHVQGFGRVGGFHSIFQIGVHLPDFFFSRISRIFGIFHFPIIFGRTRVRPFLFQHRFLETKVSSSTSVKRFSTFRKGLSGNSSVAKTRGNFGGHARRPATQEGRHGRHGRRTGPRHGRHNGQHGFGGRVRRTGAAIPTSCVVSRAARTRVFALQV